jgi:phosphohistidine phosphatase
MNTNLRLYLLRHGLAVPPGTEGIKSDATRPLTPEGIQAIRHLALWMKKKRLKVDGMVSSPALRARETSLLIAKGLPFSGKIQFSKTLLPHGNFKIFFAWLKKNKNKKNLLCVGHQPSLGEFALKLALENSLTRVDFKEGSLCCIDLPKLSLKTGGKIKWIQHAKADHTRR